MSPRFRVPWSKPVTQQGIPIREKPMFNFTPPKTASARYAESTIPIPKEDYVRPGLPTGFKAAPAPFDPRDMPSFDMSPAQYISPPLPLGGTRNVPDVALPPIPRDYTPNISLYDIGPVGSPAYVSPADVGPIGVSPDMPTWLQEEARLKPPEISFPEMPYEIQQEARFGVHVAPQVEDYIAPPVTTPQEQISLSDVMRPPSDQFILDQIEGDLPRALYDAPGLDSELSLKDLSMDLLKSTSRFAGGIGQTQGRTLGEGI